jgi:hypothetical protein
MYSGGCAEDRLPAAIIFEPFRTDSVILPGARWQYLVLRGSVGSGRDGRPCFTKPCDLLKGMAEL